MLISEKTITRRITLLYLQCSWHFEGYDPSKACIQSKDTIQVLFKQPKGEEVKIAMVNITWSVKSTVQSQGMTDGERKEDCSSIC